MSTFLEIKNTIEKIGEAFEEYKQVNDKRVKDLGEGKDVSALDEKLSKLDKTIAKLDSTKTALEKEMEFNRERIEALEAKATNPKRTAHDQLKSVYSETFETWVRSKGQDSVAEAKMQELGRKAAHEFKDVTIGSSAGGGYAVPEEIARQIEKLEQKFSPVRDLVKVVQTSTSDYKELVSLRGASSGWVGEAGSRTATDTPTLREVTPTHGELYAYPQVSEWALDDMFFNVEAWLTDEIAQEFALRTGEAVISGNGSNKPTGMLNTTPVLTADFASPMRAAAAYQYVASDTDSVDSPASPGLTGDALIDTVYALNSSYRAGASWVMNSATTGAVRKLKDANGQYHWQPGLQAGQPASLMGYPVATWEQLSDIGANNFPIGFGNWRRAYVLVDRVGLRVTRDNVTNPGFVRFYVRRRMGGHVLNNDAAKFIRTIQ